MVKRVLAIIAGACALLALFVTKPVFGLDPLQFVAIGVGALAVAVVL
jgi:hypothetical protein